MKSKRLTPRIQYGVKNDFAPPLLAEEMMSKIKRQTIIQPLDGPFQLKFVVFR
ncbi:hypothetical protein HV234_26075 [Klebsiella grimontii]|uniref:Uncharacterized protein n=1 Tax=Klebsiella grimontii TaxID=2058152 RepID=A0ABD7APW3_9ENTR|nr:MULTISPECIES: hypothetical protein [Klebsiella]QHI90037.1 hypothetical protein GUC22_25255 [Klebsiella sp. MPUS7]QLO54764.1 hypothetical protein HV234_26075 [Klebsiella grimontii]QLO80646.1 hypothetical protein HV306_27680 [Klebsiella grimontii]